MSQIRNIKDQITAKIQHGVAVFSEIGDDTARLVKATKISKSSIDIAQKCLGALPAPFKAVKKLFGDGASFLDTTSAFSVAKTVFVPGENGKYFLLDGKKPLIKRIGMIFLAACVGTSFVKAGADLGFYSLGRIAALTVAGIPAVLLVIKVTSLLYKVFSAWEAKDGLTAVKKVQAKVNKWEERRDQVEMVKNGDKATLDSLRQSYERKLNACKNQDKAEEYRLRIGLIDLDSKSLLASELETKCKSKVSYWSKELKSNEKTIPRNKLSLIESISKAFSIILGLTADVIACTATPLFVLYTGLGMFSDALAIKKSLDEAKVKKPSSNDSQVTPGGGALNPFDTPGRSPV